MRQHLQKPQVAVEGLGRESHREVAEDLAVLGLGIHLEAEALAGHGSRQAVVAEEEVRAHQVEVVAVAVLYLVHLAVVVALEVEAHLGNLQEVVAEEEGHVVDRAFQEAVAEVAGGQEGHVY